MAQTVALFDFDGTISFRDSFLAFLLFEQGIGMVARKIISLAPSFALFFMGIIGRNVLKERVFARFFQGYNANRFADRAKEFSLSRLPALVRKKALDRIDWHRAQGHRIIVVSASIEEWLKPWCDANSLELIATRVEKNNGMITGRFLSANCHGPEKARRVKEYLDLASCGTIFAYGNSAGDRELLALADKPFSQAFHE